MSATVEIVGDGFAGLIRAVDEVRRGGSVTYVEPGLRAGGAVVTESFLSPFRFNLGPPLIRRPPLPSLHVFVPDPLIRIGETTGAGSPALRAFLGGGDTDDLVVVSGGNGVASACLVDEIVAAGSRVVEGVGAVDRGTDPTSGIGIARLFVGLHGPAPVGDVFAVVVGTDDEAVLLQGDPSQQVGCVISNAHLDANLVDPELSSFVWQAAMPFGASISRAAYTDAVLERLGVDPLTVLFKLLWLPEDTGERMEEQSR